MSDPFILEALKNPVSPPILIIVYLLSIFFILAKLTKENLNKLPIKENQNKVILFCMSIVILLSSIFFHFYKMAEVPAAGHEDDAKIVIAAYILKNSGHDTQGKSLPYYPDMYFLYHNEHGGGEGQRPIPVYLQSLIQYFVPAGHFSYKLESTLIILFTTIIMIYISLFLTKDWTASILFGSLFILLPWTRTFARMTAESTSYCFASASFLLSVFYIIKNKNISGIFFYTFSLLILFISYAPGLMLASTAGFAIPLLLINYSKEYKNLSIKLLISSFTMLGIFYFIFKDDSGFKYCLLRSQQVGLENILHFDSGQINELLKKTNTYTANFLAYLLPHYLFIGGDGNFRHNTQFGGQLFVTLFIAFYTGLVYVFEKSKRDINLRILFVYIFLAILPAAICIEGGTEHLLELALNALRAGAALPAMAIVLIFGFIIIFRKSKILFSLYLFSILTNMYFFYYDYYNEYPKRLGNSWICDSGIPQVTSKALDLLHDNPDKRLYFDCSEYSIIYNNLDKIGIKKLLSGSDELSRIYHNIKDGEPRKGDFFLAQEPFDYSKLNKEIKFILRVPNVNLENNAYGASLCEIVGD